MGLMQKIETMKNLLREVSAGVPTEDGGALGTPAGGDMAGDVRGLEASDLPPREEESDDDDEDFLEASDKGMTGYVNDLDALEKEKRDMQGQLEDAQRQQSEMVSRL